MVWYGGITSKIPLGRLYTQARCAGTPKYIYPTKHTCDVWNVLSINLPMLSFCCVGMHELPDLYKCLHELEWILCIYANASCVRIVASPTEWCIIIDSHMWSAVPLESATWKIQHVKVHEYLMPVVGIPDAGFGASIFVSPCPAASVGCCCCCCARRVRTRNNNRTLMFHTTNSTNSLPNMPNRHIRRSCGLKYFQV